MRRALLTLLLIGSGCDSTPSLEGCVGRAPACYEGSPSCCAVGASTASCVNDAWECPAGRWLGSECDVIRAACAPISNDGGARDAGPPSGDDAGIDWPRVETETGPADYSCLGGVGPPIEIGRSFTLRLSAALDMGVDLSGLQIRYYPRDDLAIGATCAPPCTTVTTDIDGTVTLMSDTSSTFAFYVDGGDTTGGFLDLAAQHFRVPTGAGDEAVGTLITQNDADLLASLLGAELISSASGAVLGAALDCLGQTVANASVRVLDPDGRVVLLSRDGPLDFYLSPAGPPIPDGLRTGRSGVFGVGGLPGSPDPYVVQIWGSRGVEGVPELLSCESVLVPAGRVAQVEMRPLTSNRAPGCE